MSIEHLSEQVACPLCMGSVAIPGSIARATCPHCGLEFPLRQSKPEPPQPREDERGPHGEIRLESWLQDEPYEFSRAKRHNGHPGRLIRAWGGLWRCFSVKRSVQVIVGSAALIAVVLGITFLVNRGIFVFPGEAVPEEARRDVLPAEPIRLVCAKNLKKPEEIVLGGSGVTQPQSQVVKPAAKQKQPTPELPQNKKRAQRETSPIWLLAAQAERRLAEHPKASLLFAAEAARRGLVEQGYIAPDVEQTLRDAIGALRKAGLRFSEASIRFLVTTSDGHWLAAGGDSKHAYLWDLTRLRETRKPFELSGHRAPITTLAADPTNHVLASGDESGDLILWNLEKDDPTRSPQLLSLFSDAVEHVAVNADGRRLVAVGKEDGLSVVKWIDLTSPARLPQGLERLSEEIDSVALDPKGTWAAVAGEGKRVHVYLLRQQPPIRKRVLAGHESRVSCVRAMGDGSHFVSAGADGVVCLWDLRQPKGSEPIRFRHEGGAIRDLAVSPDDTWLAARAADQTVRLWNLKRQDTEKRGAPLEVAPEGVVSMGFAEKGEFFVATGEDRSVRMWRLSDTKASTHPLVLRGHTAPPRHLAGAATGWIVTATEKQAASGSPAIRFWDTNPKGLLRTAATLIEKELPSENRQKLLAELSGPSLIR